VCWERGIASKWAFETNGRNGELGELYLYVLVRLGLCFLYDLLIEVAEFFFLFQILGDRVRIELN